MRATVALLLTGLIIAFAGEGLAADPAKIALVIGNAKYPDNELVLNDAANDANDLAEELMHDGFVVDKAINLTGDAMRKALDRFYGRIAQGSVALIFFDGFGVQSNRQTYLLPVDAQIWTEPDVSREGFALEAILGEMHNRGAAIKIALIEASRRNPFERRFRRYSAGLAPVVTPANSLVLYSTGLGSVVTNSKNDHGLFVTELLREMSVPGVSAEQALTNTKDGVVNATNKEQVPWLSSSLTSEFSFTGPAARPPDKPADQTPAKPEPQKTEPPKPACEAAQPDSGASAEDLARDPVIADLSRKIAANGNDAVARYQRGQVYAIRHLYVLAVADFDAVLGLDPKDAEALNNRCWTRAAIGDLQSALADCDQALQIDPGLTDALDSRGLVNLKLGKTTEAIKDYSDAIQRNPRASSSLFGRGIATKRSGGDGAKDIALAKSLDPNIAKEFAGYGVTECAP
ncbi:caspase family protein [Bradyrhizobium iriomotense]|nr:caspase family protein [Bradyrhizobium iriomotense]